MALYLPQRWRRQPQYPVEIDLSHPLMIECVHYFTCEPYRVKRPDDWLGNALFWDGTYGLNSIYHHPAGSVAWNTSTSTNQDVWYTSSIPDAGTKTISGWSKRILNALGADVATPGFQGATNNWLDTQAGPKLVPACYNGGSYSYSSEEITSTGVYSTGYTWANNGDIQQTVNGAFVGVSDTNITRPATSGGTLHNGANGRPCFDTGNTAGPSGGNMTIASAMWQRELVEAEFKTLHENPWQVFQPQIARIYSFPAAAGGLSIPVAAYHYNHNIGSKL